MSKIIWKIDDNVPIIATSAFNLLIFLFEISKLVIWAANIKLCENGAYQMFHCLLHRYCIWTCLWCWCHDVWHWLQNLEYIFWRKCICSFEDLATPHNIPHYFRILPYQEDYLTFFLFIICKLHWQARIFYILCKSYCLWCVTFKGTKVESNTQKIKYTIMGK